MRVLDVGCGWGSFAIHAAREHGVSVLGITLSEPQAELARERVADGGARPIRSRSASPTTAASSTSSFDAIASIGMAEHVGEKQIDVYARTLFALLRPGGTLLNHAIAALDPPQTRSRTCSQRATSSPTASRCRCRASSSRSSARASTASTSRAFARTTRSRYATGPSASTSISRRPSSSQGSSVCACGGCICAPPGTALRLG